MRQYTDKMFVDRRWILSVLENENRNQLQKWGVQTHSSFEWLAYTTEELGSLSKAISEYEYRKGPILNIVDEAVQVATLALKIAEMYYHEAYIKSKV